MRYNISWCWYVRKGGSYFVIEYMCGWYSTYLFLLHFTPENHPFLLSSSSMFSAPQILQKTRKHAFYLFSLKSEIFQMKSTSHSDSSSCVFTTSVRTTYRHCSSDVLVSLSHVLLSFIYCLSMIVCTLSLHTYTIIPTAIFFTTRLYSTVKIFIHHKPALIDLA